MPRPSTSDVRSTTPNRSGHRLARFKDGWRNAARGKRYAESTLRRVTWENTGYRLGVLFPDTDEILIEAQYDWCVRQQKHGKRPEPKRSTPARQSRS